MWFFKVDSDQLLVYWLRSRHFSGGEKRSTHKSKILAQITPGKLLSFLLTYSLYNRFWHIAYLIFAIFVRLVEMVCRNVTRKKSKTTRWTITYSQLIIFWVSDPRKNNSLFLLLSVIAVRTPLLGLARSINYKNFNISRMKYSKKENKQQQARRLLELSSSAYVRS